MGIWPVYLLKHASARKLCVGKAGGEVPVYLLRMMDVIEATSQGLPGEDFLNELEVGMGVREV